MTAKLVLAPEVEDDLRAAYGWYEERRRGLGEDFLDCVDACIQGICRLPLAHATIHEEYRRAMVRRFPYVIFYEFVEGTVTIYCVFHASRDPNDWRNRLT